MTAAGTCARPRRPGRPRRQPRQLAPGTAAVGPDLPRRRPTTVGLFVLVLTGAIGAVPRLPVDPDASPLRAALLHPDAVAARSSTRSASPPCWSAPSRSPWSPWWWPSRWRSCSRCSSPTTRPKRIKSWLDLGRRPDGRRAEHHLRPLGLLPPPAPRHQRVPVAEPVLRLDPDLPRRHRPERRRVAAVAATPSSAFIAGLAVVHDGHPAGLRRDARRLRPGTARRAGGGHGARRHPLRRGPDGRAARSPRAASSAGPCWRSAGPWARRRRC